MLEEAPFALVGDALAIQVAGYSLLQIGLGVGAVAVGIGVVRYGAKKLLG
jgi:hypothetical protein